jgi:anaerobic selenocysteine-containing dehydrogenase
MLIARRSKFVMNSLGRQIPIGTPTNPCACHPDDLVQLGLEEGDAVVVTSDHGSVTTWVTADATLRPGVVSMTHCFGDLPGHDEPARTGANPSRLLSLTDGGQAVSHMPWMSAVPVSITRQHTEPVPS